MCCVNHVTSRYQNRNSAGPLSVIRGGGVGDEAMKYIWKVLISGQYSSYEVSLVAENHIDAIERAFVWAWRWHRISRKRSDIARLERTDMKVFV